MQGHAGRGEGARQMQGHAGRGEDIRGCALRGSAAGTCSNGARCFVADEPTQPIFDDEPPEDIAPRHTPGHTARHCARANVFFLRNPVTSARLVAGLLLTRTGRGHSVAAFDIRDLPCSRRANIPALERGQKSWSPTIKALPHS